MIKIDVVSIRLTNDETVNLAPGNVSGIHLIGEASRRLEEVIRAKLRDGQEWSCVLAVVRRSH
jgi:hypothetical protein